MGISRPTFGRLVEGARRKVADALFHGRALAFEGGAVACEGLDRPPCGCCGRRRHRGGGPDGTCGGADTEGSGVPTGGGGRCRGRCRGNGPHGV
jgi:hypothetical protein